MRDELLDWAFRGKRSSGHKINLKGFKVKDGKVVRDLRRLDVSTRLKQKASKRVRVTRRGSNKWGS